MCTTVHEPWLLNNMVYRLGLLTIETMQNVFKSFAVRNRAHPNGNKCHEEIKSTIKLRNMRSLLQLRETIATKYHIGHHACI